MNDEHVLSPDCPCEPTVEHVESAPTLLELAERNLRAALTRFDTPDALRSVEVYLKLRAEGVN